MKTDSKTPFLSKVVVKPYLGPKWWSFPFLSHDGIAKFSSSWLVQSSLAELRLAMVLIIATHPPTPGIVVIQGKIDHV